jgi:hypothetical protein
MANKDAPRGLTPVRHRNGAPYTGSGNAYYVPSTYATSLFVGELVVKTGTSNTALVKDRGQDYAPGTLPEINKTAAGDGNPSTGVIMGFAPDPSNLDKSYGLASTERVAFVCDDPDVVFQIQDDGAAALAATVVGLNAVVIDTHAGSTSTGRAGTELDTNSDAPAADASNQLTIQRLAAITDNALGANAVWEVKINNHTESAGVIGI